MKDVAREAGVSLGTVSSVLNGKASVKPENYAKVMKAVESLGYEMNLTARALKVGHSYTIGLLIPDITNPYYPELARGVEDAAMERGYRVFLGNIDRKLSKETEYINAMASQHVSGLILVKPQSSKEVLNQLSSRIPLVLVDSERFSRDVFDLVNVNDEQGIRLAIEHLIEMGHTQIAYIGGEESSLARLHAFRKTMQQHHLPVPDEYVIENGFDWYSGFEAVQQLLKAPEMPTAVFCVNDIVAIGALKALSERGLSVPRDVSLVGFDNISQASLSWPPLTTIHLPKYELGAASLNLLVDRIEGKRDNSHRVVKIFEPSLIMRNSVNYPVTLIKYHQKQIKTNYSGKVQAKAH